VFGIGFAIGSMASDAGSHHKISILCCGGAEVAVRVTRITSGTLEEVLRVTGGVEHMIDSREVEVDDAASKLKTFMVTLLGEDAASRSLLPEDERGVKRVELRKAKADARKEEEEEEEEVFITKR